MLPVIIYRILCKPSFMLTIEFDVNLGILFVNSLVGNGIFFVNSLVFTNCPPIPKNFEKHFKKCRKPLIYKGFHHFQGGIFFVNTPHEKRDTRCVSLFSWSCFPFRIGLRAPNNARSPVRRRARPSGGSHTGGEAKPFRSQGEITKKAQGTRFACPLCYGADYGARTRHLRLGKATLYQMS